jgi:1,4-dihydroxy-2-naphthoate octaprenyltransferase
MEKRIFVMNPWLLAARPKTLPAGLCPVLMGGVLAWGDGVFHAPAFLAALIGALLIQIGTNYANDYFDFMKGTDTADRIGPTRATQAGMVTPQAMRNAMIMVFALALLPGAYLILRGGAPILVIGLISIACGILYTGGPWPLGYLGLGDLFVLLFFGPVAVAGTYYVQAQSCPPEALLAGLAPGLFSTAILTVNNLRDADTDIKTGKRTLAVRFGKTFARWEYAACLVLAALGVPIALVLHTGDHGPVLLAAAVLVPAWPLIRRVFRESGAALNAALADTGKLLLAFTLLFSAGWLL